MRIIIALLIAALFNIAFSVSAPTNLRLGDGICRPSGCSGQICSDKSMISTCEFRPSYACYRGATCTRQANGMCGWTMTDSLKDCLAKAGSGSSISAF